MHLASMRSLFMAGILLAGGGLGLLGQAPTPPVGGSVPGEPPKVEVPADCLHCGMNRTQFARSRMKVGYEDGGSAGTCSIHCTAIELAAQAGRKVTALQVGDYGVLGHPLIDARTASWVIGGSVRGVMTPVAKWAFSSKAAAETFIAKNGGRMASCDEAIEAARQDPQKRH